MSPTEQFSTLPSLGLQNTMLVASICPAGHHTEHFTGIPLLNAHHSDISGILVRDGFRCRSNLAQVPLCVCTLLDSYIQI